MQEHSRWTLVNKTFLNTFKGPENLLFSVSFHWFQVGGTQLENGDVIYFHASLAIFESDFFSSLTLMLNVAYLIINI